MICLRGYWSAGLQPATSEQSRPFSTLCAGAVTTGGGDGIQPWELACFVESASKTMKRPGGQKSSGERKPHKRFSAQTTITNGCRARNFQRIAGARRSPTTATYASARAAEYQRN